MFVAVTTLTLSCLMMFKNLNCVLRIVLEYTLFDESSEMFKI